MLAFNFICIAIIVIVISIVLPVVKSDDERKHSMFKVGDEWLALPEVHSVLDFAADTTYAIEEDLEGQLQLRSSRYWGRLYINGWPQSIQFFRAHFGIEPPIGQKTLVFAEPRDACTDLSNANLLTENHVLLVNRGICTFGTKSKVASRTNASAVIIINNEPGLEHLPGPDAYDIAFSVTSIPQQEGQLLESYYDENEGILLQGYLIPMNCDRASPSCMPATWQERQYLESLNDGGLVHITRPESTASNSLINSDFTIEYLLGYFGVKIFQPLDSNSTASTPYAMTVARPAEACASIENDVKGKLVLVRRGGCPFFKKAEEVQAAGGRAMIVGSTTSYIVRMGVEPRWKGLSSAIPVVMVSKRAYSILVAESYMGSKLSFQERNSVNGSTWQTIENLYNGEGWPRSETYVTKKYDELKKEHANWPDRLQTLDEAYSKKLKSLSASATAAGIEGKENLDSTKSEL